MKWVDHIGVLKKRIVDSRFVRLARYLVHNTALPGNKGVPLYDVVSYLLYGIIDGKLWRAAKGLAFSLLMALPPLLIFMFTLIAFLPVDGLQDELLFELQDIIPEKVFGPISNTINDVMGHKHKSLLSIGFIASVILASNAVHGMMMFFVDRNQEQRKFISRYPICILLVFLLYIMVVLVLVLLIGYKTILMWLFKYGILIPGSFTHIGIGIGRWVILVSMALLTLSVVYYVIPLKKHRVGFFSSGAVFATIMFILLSWGFKVYLANFNRYNLLYGSIGTVLVMMLWLFLNSLVVMLGYELNTAILNGTIKGHRVEHRLRYWSLKQTDKDMYMLKEKTQQKISATTNNN